MAAAAEEPEREKEEKDQEKDEEEDTEAEEEDTKAEGKEGRPRMRRGSGQVLAAACAAALRRVPLRSARHRARKRNRTGAKPQPESAPSSAGHPSIAPCRGGIFWDARAAARTCSPQESFPLLAGRCEVREECEGALGVGKSSGSRNALFPTHVNANIDVLAS